MPILRAGSLAGEQVPHGGRMPCAAASRAANLGESIWACRQLREWLQSRDEKETDAERVAEAGDQSTLSLRVRYYLVLIRLKLRLLALRVLRRFAGLGIKITVGCAILQGVAAHAAETVELNEHRDAGSVALGCKPKLEFVHLTVAAPTPNSGFAIRRRYLVGFERLSETPELNSHRQAVPRRRITPSGERLLGPRLLCR